MKHSVTLLEDDDYDLNDDIGSDYDLATLPRATEQERRFRAQARANLIRLAPDVAEVFPTSDAVNEALRQLIREHAGQSVAIVCHGGVIRMILSILLDLALPKMAAFEIDYATVTQVEHHERKTEATLINFAPWRDLP